MDQQQTPQWSPPPQQPAGWGAGTMAPAARPLGVTLSSIWFYFIGILALLGAVLLIAGTQILEGAFGGGVFAGVGIVFALIIGLFAVLFILVGWGIWKGRGWGRIGGIVIGILGVLGALGQLTSQNGLVGGIIQLAIWAGVIYALWMAKAWFAAR
jgi:hypothetical protein